MGKSGRTTLNELMGQGGDHFAKNGLELHDLHKLLGDQMPRLEFHPLGRHRLVQALYNRFGEGFRSVPGISEVLQKFDAHAKREIEFHKIKKRLGV